MDPNRGSPLAMRTTGGLEFSGSGRAPWPALATAVVFLRDQFPMPGERTFSRVISRRHASAKEVFVPDPWALTAKATPAVMFEPQRPPSTEIALLKKNGGSTSRKHVFHDLAHWRWSS